MRNSVSNGNIRQPHGLKVIVAVPYVDDFAAFAPVTLYNVFFAENAVELDDSVVPDFSVRAESSTADFCGELFCPAAQVSGGYGAFVGVGGDESVKCFVQRDIAEQVVDLADWKAAKYVYALDEALNKRNISPDGELCELGNLFLNAEM